MAATAVYVKISPVGATPGGSPAVEFSDISATPAAFHLTQGRYIAQCIASTYGTVTLQVLGPDGSTYMTVLTAFSANGLSAATDLPDGTYQLTIA